MALTKATNRMTSGAVVNVLDYGADPTGTADSTSAINAAIAAGNHIYFPSGTYDYSGTLSIPDGKVIEGAAVSDTNINFTNAAVDAVQFYGINLVIKNITVTGGLRGLKAGDEAGGPDDNPAREMLIEKVFFVNQASHGIDIQKGWSNYFKEVKVFNPAGSAVRFGTGFTNSTKFEGLRVSDIGSQYTILFNGSTSRSVEFNHCIIEGNANATSRGFYSDTGSTLVGITLKECYFETHTGYFIDFSNTTNYGILVDGCDFVGDLIGINGPTGLSIQNCSFTGDPGSGYFISNPVDCVIMNCSARTSGGSWSTRSLIGGSDPVRCLICNTGDDSPEGIGTILPDNVGIGVALATDRLHVAPADTKPAARFEPTKTTPTSTTNVVLTANGETYLVTGSRGSSGSAVYIANASAGTVTSIGSTGTWGGSLAWSGNDLQGTAPAAGDVAWYAIKFN